MVSFTTTTTCTEINHNCLIVGLASYSLTSHSSGTTIDFTMMSSTESPLRYQLYVGQDKKGQESEVETNEKPYGYCIAHLKSAIYINNKVHLGHINENGLLNSVLRLS